MDASQSRRPPLHLLALFGVLASSISGVAYWDHLSQKEALETEVRHQVLVIADTKVRQIADWRAQQLGHVRFIRADQMSLIVLDRVARRRTMVKDVQQAQDWLLRLCQELHYANAYLTDTDGSTLLHAGRTIGAEAHIRELALETLRRDQIAITDFHVGESGTVHLGLNLPLRLTPESPAFGALLLAIDPADYLYQLMESWPVPSQSGEILLVRRDGDDVLYLSELQHFKNATLQMRVPLSRTNVISVKAVHGLEGNTEGVDYRGVPVFAAIRKVPETAWYLIAKVDSDEVRAPLRWRSAMLGIGAVSLILAAGVIVAFLWRRQQWQSESLFQSAFEQSALGMNHVSLDGLYVRVNQRFCEITGYSREELARMGPADITHPDDWTLDRERIRSLLSGELDTFSRDKRFIRKDGRLVWVRLTGSVLRSPNGRPVHLIGAVEDIGEQMKAEEALRLSEERFRLVVQHAPDAIMVETGLRVRFANAEALRMFGVKDPCDLIGRSALDRIHPEERSAVEARSRRVNTGIPADRAERRCLRMDGEIVFVEASIVPIEYEGQPSSLVFMRNISERKKNEAERTALEEQLRQAQKMESIGRLAGGVAHDFNNLLTVINGYSDMLLQQELTGAEALESLAEIRMAGDRAASLTQQLLAFSRKQIAEPKPISLNDVVEEEQKMIQRLIGEDIEVLTHLAPELGLIMADRGQMHQILLNLTVNARDAMPGGGRITIDTANADLTDAQICSPDDQPGAYILLTVTDTGSGMSPEVQEKIFEPFFTTKPRGTGTGLGLSTVYGIVRQNGGCIQVSSEPGKGASFRIFLPRTEKPAMLRGQPLAVDAADGNETILVVEDQAELRKLVLAILGHHGYRLLDAANGAEALELAGHFADPIHLLLTDVVMPGMTGSDLAGRLKHLQPRMKVLFMSGYPEDFIGRQGVLEPGVAYLPKPFTPNELSLKVRDLLANPEQDSIPLIDDDDAMRGHAVLPQ